MAGAVGLRRLVRPLLFIAAYVSASRVTEGLTLENGFTAWYPPAALTLAYLTVVGPTGALTALIARFVNTAVIFPDAWSDEADGVIARGLAITACYTLGAWALRELAGERQQLRQLGSFVAIGVVSVPFGAALSVAAVSVALLDADADSALDAARTVWIGDAVAIATFVPAILLFVAWRQGRGLAPRVPKTSPGRTELGVQAAGLIGMPIGALWLAQEYDNTSFLVLTVVPVIWVALRGDLLTAAVGLLVANTSLTIVAGVWLGATASLSELQVVMIVTALGALYVVGVAHTQAALLADLLESENRYRTVVDQVPCIVVRFDLRGRVRFANLPSWVDPRLDIEDIVAPLRAEWSRITGPVLAEGQHAEFDWEIATPDGDDHLWFSGRLGGEQRADGALDAVVAVITDLTPRRQAELELDRERWQDPLTGLANRRRFLDLLAPLAALPDARPLGIAMLDLDGFKGLNESLGHDEADGVLLEVAGRLRERVGSDGVVARLTADEFAVALPVAGAEDIVAFGEQLVRELRMKVPMGEREIVVTCSVGVACGGEQRTSASVLYDASSAVLAAKEAGGDRCATFEAGRRLATVERETRLALIHHAMDNGQVVVHYQPIVDLVSGDVLSVEALVRLADADAELLLPGTFIDLIEEQGLDLRLGQLVLEKAMADLAAWSAAGASSLLRVAINVTARELTQPGFVNQVLATCRRHGVEPDRLRLELTETMVMADLDAAVRALEGLRAKGVTAALDDFGIGYSSMAYLQRLPVDVLKIDKSFVAGLPDDEDDRSIVGLVVGLARALNLDVTAEGIESEEQRQALVELGCRAGQGFLFDRPVDAPAIARRLGLGVPPVRADVPG